MPSPTRVDATNLQGDPTVLQTGHQSYEDFRKSLDLPSSDGDGPSTLPLPKLPIPPFEVPASVLAAEAEAATARDAEESELEAMTLQPGASRDATQSPKTCRLRMDNFVEPDSEDEEPEGPGGEAVAGADDADDDDADDDRPPIVLPGMVPQSAASAGPAAASGVRAVMPLPRPAAASAASAAAAAAARLASAEEGLAPAAASDPDDLLATINALDDEREEEGEEATVDSGTPPAAEAAAAAAATAALEQAEDAGPEAVVAFSLDPDFDYENIKLTERFSVERALKEGEYYDKGAA